MERGRLPPTVMVLDVTLPTPTAERVDDGGGGGGGGDGDGDDIARAGDEGAGDEAATPTPDVDGGKSSSNGSTIVMPPTPKLG